MPRIRTIKPKFWDDIKLSKISRDARLIFIGIWNFSDDLGVIVAEPDYLKSKILPYDKLNEDQFENWLKELIDKKFILPITYNEELFFYIRTFDRHQRIEKPNHIDICIERQQLNILINNNHGTITEQSRNNPQPIEGGKEGKGIIKERKGKEGESAINHVFWETEKKSFMNAGDWIFKFCTDKNIPVELFDKKAKEFISDLELKEDYKEVKELKRHFTNWYNIVSKNENKNGSKHKNKGFVEVSDNIDYDNMKL